MVDKYYDLIITLCAKNLPVFGSEHSTTKCSLLISYF